jgi:hypothetical protein
MSFTDWKWSLFWFFTSADISLLFLGLVKLAFKEFDLLLEKSLLLVELGLGCHAGSLDLFRLLFLLGDLGSLLIKLTSAVTLELLKALRHILFKMIFFSGELGKRFSRSLLFGKGFGSLSF